MYSFSMSFCMVPESRRICPLAASPPATYSDSKIAAVELMVIDVEIFVQIDAIEQALHVGDGIDCHSHAPDLADRQRMVRIHTHLRGKVEGHGQAGGALSQQVPGALVDSSALPMPAYWRMVHSRPRYIWLERPGCKG